MSLVYHELKVRFKSWIIWAFCLILTVWGGMTKYDAYSQSAGALFEQIPKSMRQLLGMGEFDMSTLSGYFVMLFFYLSLALLVHAALLGASCLVAEEVDHTSEFLLSKPLSRRRIFWTKTGVGSLYLLAINGITLISSLVFTALENPQASIAPELLLLFLGLLVIQLFIFSLSVLGSMIVADPRRSTMIATLLVSFIFLIHEVISLDVGLDFLRFLDPLSYFSQADILYQNTLNGWIMLTVCSVSVVVLVSAQQFYKNRDIRAL